MQKVRRQQSTPNDAVVGKTTSHVTSHNNHKVTLTLNRGSYMSAHVLLNLSNELGEKDKMRDFAEYLIGFPQRI